MKLSIYKIINLLSSAGIIVAGGVYLYAGKSVLGIVLTVFSALLCVMGVSNALEAKKASNDATAYIPAVCLFILAIAVGAAAVARFVCY